MCGFGAGLVLRHAGTYWNNSNKLDVVLVFICFAANEKEQERDQGKLKRLHIKGISHANTIRKKLDPVSHDDVSEYY